jgi:CHAT domain-containing protein
MNAVLGLSVWLVCLLLVCADAVSAAEVPQADVALSEGPRGHDITPPRTPKDWEDIAKAAAERGDRRAATEAWVRMADAQQALGGYGLAVETLDRALATAREQGDDASLIAMLRGTRGNLYIAVASPADARAELEAALALARGAGAGETTATISNNLGNHFASQGDLESALAAYASAAELALALGNGRLAARAYANAARATADAGDAAQTTHFVGLADAQLGSPSATAVSGPLSIHLARSLNRVRDRQATGSSSSKTSPLEIHRLLLRAHQISAERGDARSDCYALGYLAELYASQGRTEEALELTRRAIGQARRAKAPEVRYAWHAQAARLLETLGRRDEAIEEYAESVALLERLRHMMAVRYGRASESFRERVGGVYFGYVDLLLRRAAARSSAVADLELAQQTLELLKAAELRDYYRDECVDNMLSSQVSVRQASPTAAIIYPVLLPDRIEILVSTRSKIWRTSVPIGLEEATAELHKLRRALEQRITREYLRPARTVYGWLIEPILPDLEAAEVDSLVFVPDGPLRSVPMSALHDGEHFLIERFAIAITPGLSLTDPQPLERVNARLLAGGLSQGVQGHVPLPHVERELEQIAATFESTVLLDEEFRRARIEEELGNQAYSIVHIASHASFDRDAEETYVLTHAGRLSMDDLAAYVGLFRFRDQPLDLLMLSACETAAGDDRSALGLSGLAIKAGARSAIGTLWSVNDEAASLLVGLFYQYLSEGEESRAETLRRAQMTLIANPKFHHPAYWSAFLLISNWL